MTNSPLDDLFGASGGGDFLDEAGTYDFVISKAEAKTSGNGKPQIKLNMKVVGGPQDGKTLVHTLTYSPESEVALSIFARSLAAWGANQDFARQVAAQLPEGAQIATFVTEAAKLAVGRTVVATTAPDKDNQREEYRDRQKVQWDLKAPKNGATAPPVAAEQAADAVIAPAPADDAGAVPSTDPAADAPPF